MTLVSIRLLAYITIAPVLRGRPLPKSVFGFELDNSDCFGYFSHDRLIRESPLSPNLFSPALFADCLNTPRNLGPDTVCLNDTVQIGP